MLDFVRLMTWLVDKYFVLLVVLYILCKGITALYLKLLCYSKWWLSLIPLGHWYCKYELGAVTPWLLVPTGIMTLLASYTYDIVFMLVCLVLSLISELLYSKTFIGCCNSYLWTFVPFAKYIIMVKEVITYARDGSR